MPLKYHMTIMHLALGSLKKTLGGAHLFRKSNG
jgi:hypothetical protein